MYTQKSETKPKFAGQKLKLHAYGIKFQFNDNSYQIIASDISAGDYFGISVAIDGNYALVGAHYNDYYGSENVCYYF